MKKYLFTFEKVSSSSIWEMREKHNQKPYKEDGTPIGHYMIIGLNDITIFYSDDLGKKTFKNIICNCLCLACDCDLFNQNEVDYILDKLTGRDAITFTRHDSKNDKSGHFDLRNMEAF